MSIEEQIQNKIQDFKIKLQKIIPPDFHSATSFSIECNDLLNSTYIEINRVILYWHLNQARISVEAYHDLIQPRSECQRFLETYIDRHIQKGTFD